MPSDLESRFLRFLATLQDAESLDELLGDPKFDGQRRADYLLFGRRVILELKSLETDTSHKVESEMDKHRDREDFPLFYGTVDLQAVLKHLPDGKEINDRIFYKTTRLCCTNPRADALTPTPDGLMPRHPPARSAAGRSD